VTQPVVLAGQLIAFFDEAGLRGPLRITLGPRRQHQGAQRSGILGQALLYGHGRIIAPRQPCVMPQP